MEVYTGSKKKSHSVLLTLILLKLNQMSKHDTSTKFKNDFNICLSGLFFNTTDFI